MHRRSFLQTAITAVMVLVFKVSEDVVCRTTSYSVCAVRNDTSKLDEMYHNQKESIYILIHPHQFICYMCCH